MMVEKTDTLVVGAGQAGIAVSEHLGRAGIPHLVLERARIAERWRSERWDALVANGPAWHDRFPGMEFPKTGPDGFPGKEEVAAYLASYAARIGAPIRTGVEVRRAARLDGRPGFAIETSQGPIEAQNIVAATGAFQKPLMPRMIPEEAGFHQIHSCHYRNPAQLPEGAVLVVGAGSSGAQIAEELMLAGRDVYLSVGPHDRPPRAYRGRDFCWWLGVLGKWDMAAPAPGAEHVTIAVSGARGGHTADFRRFAQQGMTLLGRTEGYAGGALQIADDLRTNLDRGDANYLALLDEADAYVSRNGLDLPPEPEARDRVSDAECITHPLRSLDLAEAGITSVIWSVGYGVDYSWIKLDAFHPDGRPLHHRGVSPEPGLYYLGLPWQSRRGSSFIWGVWHDAKYIADQIGIQHKYRDYHTQAAQQAEDA
ncbi:putative flavoprotein involved in K+ transport [Roseovarius nanhaiticus]|uniref:Putative flavoprotein involved in K+ transport n=1 Tax=Roseovarius nanhaiticus TaxID=573024 RepID=A0A1N7GX95_9RHOB|nr:NAD(P)/FAD-dependent oxidoreductase [Roseovarius nanhaiticus]SEL20887.1 putative flavoprotein involved in K+ transport [Roseovarius nanhaiticus]SIS17194.1 putative flavoprotein involved in K+ transport [Roseovarius nanhaiticus]